MWLLLIVYLVGGQPATATQQMAATQQMCERAKEAVNAQGQGKVIAICYPAP
jgi:hypothetical protein